MAEKVIFAEQTVNGFAYVEGQGVVAGASGLFALETGAKYRVVWDGKEFYCQAYEADVGMVSVFIGNEAIVTGVGSEIVEPFAICYISSYDYTSFTAMDGSTDTSHTVAIYQDEEEMKIVLRDHTDTPNEYALPERLRVDTADGGTTEFVHESLVPEQLENVPITLNFSGGNQYITAEEGTAVKSAVIQQPADLIPENIAKGVKIAGIEGMLTGGGGELKIAHGSVSGAGTTQIVTHNLGVKPDIVIACGIPPTGAYQAYYMTGYSAKALAASVGTYIGAKSAWNSTSQIVQNTEKKSMEERTEVGSIIHDPQEDTFKIGFVDIIGTKAYFPSGKVINWIAIGGLT